MDITFILKTAITGLKTHKSRSILTILGIVIGITSIILVMSLGQGAQDLILGQIQSIGPKIISIMPGRQPTGPTDFLSMFSDSLKQRDLDLLNNKGNVPHADKIMPIVFGSETLGFGSNTYQANVFGTTDFFAQLYDMYPDQGRIFDTDETQSYSSVAVIGSKIQDKLFTNGEDPLNEKIKIKGMNFRVIGVLPKKGQFSFLNFDEAVIVPYTTAQQYLLGIKYFNRIAVQADSEKTVAETTDDIKITLRNSHSITDPSKDDFFVETQAEAMQTVGTITSVLTLFLTSIAAISLLVGGVGIMNIMLVSVTERTREIGLRKALGATEKNILLQFLVEAVMLTALGGIIGVVLGASVSFLISLALTRVLAVSWVFTFPIMGALLGLGVAAAIGLVFGIYPARQASKKSPIEALRYE